MSNRSISPRQRARDWARWMSKSLPLGQGLLLRELAEFTDAEGISRPIKAIMERHLPMAPGSIRNSLSRLTKAGIIEVHEHAAPGRPSSYRFNVSPHDDTFAPHDDTYASSHVDTSNRTPSISPRGPGYRPRTRARANNLIRSRDPIDDTWGAAAARSRRRIKTKPDKETDE